MSTYLDGIPGNVGQAADERYQRLQRRLDKQRNAPRFGFLPGLVSGALVVGGLWVASYFAFPSKPYENKPVAATVDNKAHDNSALISENVPLALPGSTNTPLRPVTPPPPKYEVHVRTSDGRWIHEKDADGTETAYRFVVLYKELGWDHDFIQIADSRETVDLVKRYLTTIETNDVKAGRLVAEYLSPESRRTSLYGREIVAALRALAKYDRRSDPTSINISDARLAWDSLPIDGGLEQLLKK